MQEIGNYSSEIDQHTNVSVFAVLDDLSGRKYYLRTADGQYLWLDSDLKRFEVTIEQSAFAAVVKHGYKMIDTDQTFSFVERDKFLSPQD